MFIWMILVCELFDELCMIVDKLCGSWGNVGFESLIKFVPTPMI